MKHFFFTLFLSFIGLLGLSQTNKFGKITNEQWNIKECGFDSSAKSIILFDVGNISIKAKEGIDNTDPECQLSDEFFTLFYERDLRIKVLSDNGLSPDFVSINLRSLNNKNDRLTLFQGLVFTRVNEKTEQIKFGIRDLKKITNQDGSSRMVLELPGLKEGCIIDIRYKIETDILNELPYWDFRCTYPVLYSEIRYSIPDFYVITRECDIIHSLAYDSFDKNAEYGVSYQISDGWKYYKYTFTEVHEEYSLRNVPSAPDLDEMFRLKYTVSTIAYNLVTCQKGSYRKL